MKTEVRYQKDITLVFEATLGYAHFNPDRQLTRLYTHYAIKTKADLLAAIDTLRAYVVETVTD